MTNGSICCIRRTAAISHTFTYLQQLGFTVSAYPVRSTRYMILPVPSFSSGQAYLEELLPTLSKDAVIIGGNLDIPLLENRRKLDLLKDPYYLAENAAITARCALQIVEATGNPAQRPVLILGWGRIGKCLTQLLERKGADITVAARKPEDLAMIRALGFKSVQIQSVDKNLQKYGIIFNTVPAMVLPKMVTGHDALILELASTPGMAGPNILSARGLPGKMAPEASGKLIAETFIRLMKEEMK